MRRTQLILAGILAVAISHGRANAALLGNGDFESGSLTPWVQGVNASAGVYTGSPWIVNSASAHSGQFGAAADGNQQLKQTFSGISTNSIAEFSFWIKRPNANPISASNNGVLVDFFYSDSTSSSAVGRLTDANWTKFDFTSLLVAGKTLTGVDTYGYLELPGSNFVTYVDDFTLTVAPEPASFVLLSAGLIGFTLMAYRKRLLRERLSRSVSRRG
jgi:hypothetical protein